MSSVVASRTSYLTHCTFQSCTGHYSPLTGEGPPTPHTPLATPWSWPPTPALHVSLFFFPKAQTPPPRKWLVVISSHGIFLTHKTFKLHVFIPCSLPTTGTRLLLHTVHDRSSTHSASSVLCTHAHGKGLGTTQKTGTSGEFRATQTPHTTDALLLLTWLSSPSKDLPSRGPRGHSAGCKWHALAGTRTLLPRPSQPGSLFSPKDPLCSLRGASSCVGPGGRTWRNTCHSANI